MEKGNCPVDTFINFVKGKRKATIILHLKQGTKRYKELVKLLPDISDRMLSKNLKELEEAGLIKGYHADVDTRELGFEVQVFAMVRLQSQAEGDLSAFEGRCRAWPLVRECHMLNGEIDFILKCTAPDLSSFQSFLTEQLLSAPNVASVKTSLVIRCAKDQPGLPFEVLEARLAKTA